MAEKQPAAYYALLLLSLAFSVLLVVTLLPSPGASKPSVLGYRAVCSYAPASSALCGLLAAITCTVRNRMVSSRKASTRYQPPFAPAGAGLALAVLFVVSAVAFARAQSGFTAVIERSASPSGALGALAEGTRRATVSEGQVSATVEVAVSGGRLEKLSLIEASNVEASVAESIFASVRAAQSCSVDAVSGATASSQVLLRAIEAAATGAR